MKNLAAIEWKFLPVPVPTGKTQSSRGMRQLAYTDWGDPGNRDVVVCAHGLTRNCRDFDFLAAALEQDFRVVCIDMAGRGRSDWLEDAADYNSAATYVADMERVLEHIWQQNSNGHFQIYWVGVSMGGLIGMLLASRERPSVHYCFKTLVMSDIGPYVPSRILSLFSNSIGKDPRFPNLDELEAHMRSTALPYSAFTDEQWRHLAEYSAYQYGDGTVGYRYDPAISSGFRPDHIRDIDLWSYWNQLALPVFVLRGEKSEVLTLEVAARMQQHRANVQIRELAGIGHSPMLMDAVQIRLVRDYLLGIRGQTPCYPG